MHEYINFTCIVDIQKSVSPASSTEDLHSPVHVVDVESYIRRFQAPASIVNQESPETSSANCTLSQLQWTGHNNILQLSPGASPTVTYPQAVNYIPEVTGSISQGACAVESTTQSEQKLKSELLRVVQNHREVMVELMVSLSGTDRSSFVNLDDGVFVNNLLEKIKCDFNGRMRHEMHLYRYLCQKGYGHIVVELLMCPEDMIES